MTEPKTKLYFVKKPTQSSAEYGRKPVQIGTMKPVKTKRIRKIKEPFGNIEVIEPRKVKATSQQKLESLVQRERKRRAEHMYKPVELTPFAEQARQRIKAKTIVGQQQEKIARDKALEELNLRQSENIAQRQALLAIPRLLQGQTQTLMALSDPLQQNLMALQRVAPDVARHMMELSQRQQLSAPKEEEEFDSPIITTLHEAMAEPTIEEPTEVVAQRSRQVMADRELIRKLVQEEGLTSEAEIKRRFLEESPRKRMPNKYKDMIDEAKGEGKGLSFATTTTGKGRRGISEHGGDLINMALSHIGNMFKSSAGDFASKMRTNIKNNPQAALELGTNLFKHFMKGGDLESANRLDNHFKQQFDEIHGAGFFSSLKDLAKKAVSKVVDIVKEDPIGTAKKAFELGQKGREQYAKMFGKTEKGGKLFIPKKHLKTLHKFAKQTHGAGFADSFLKGLITPLSVLGKVASFIPGVGQVIGPIGMAIPSVVTALTGVKPLI